MSEKQPTDSLIGVPETMLLPLYARAMETQRADGMVNDPQAVAMMARIDYDFDKFADATPTNLGIAIRTEILDELAQNFIAKHPNALIVNIAAGLDTRYSRVDNGRLTWVDLDLPESIVMREAFITPQGRHIFIAKSALAFSWLDDLPNHEHVLFIIEGLLMYFDESEVQSLITTLAQNCSSGEIICEVMGATLAKDTARNKAVSKTGASFKWGIRHVESMADWHDKLTYVTDISIYDRHEDRWHALGLEFPAPLPKLRTAVNRIVQLWIGL